VEQGLPGGRQEASGGDSVREATSDEVKELRAETAALKETLAELLLEDLLHGDESRVCGDSAYSVQKEVVREHAPRARDFTQHKGNRHRALSAEESSRNRTKSKVRAKVEHVFHVMKRQFGYTKVRYRGLAKNAHHLFIKCALVNLVLSKKRLLRLSQAQCA
jgi:IS5 family transposase